MSATAGWYPDPGGGQDLYRFWDGHAWSAATSTNPSSPPPSQGPLGAPPAPAYGQQRSVHGQQSGAYATYEQVRKKRSPAGWWIAGAALVVVIVVVAVIAIRSVVGGGGLGTGGTGVPGGQDTGSVCPAERSDSPSAAAPPADGRVHGGPVSYPELGAPWGPPKGDNRVPFGVNVLSQDVTVESGYQPGSSWVASVLIGELQAGDGFFTPEQGSQIVVKCILGRFYGNNPVQSKVKVNQAATIDGHDAWLVESQLSFDIKGLRTKGELLIVAIVASDDERSGLFYASIPDTRPELVAPARNALKQLTVDG